MIDVSSEEFARLASLVPFLRVALDRAVTENVGSTFRLGILAYRPDGGGRIGATFDLGSFVSDMEAVFGEGDRDAARDDLAIAKIMNEHGL